MKPILLKAKVLPRRSGSPTRSGTPKTDVERVMNHYGVSREKALAMLEKKSADELLPKRGGRGIMGKSKIKTHPQKVENRKEKPMKNIDLTEFPALAKAIKRGNLSKSLEFVKTGREVYLGVMAKIGTLQGELLLAVAQWKAGIQPSTSVTDDTAVPTAEVEKATKEPWEIRTVRQKIETLQRIARNIDQKKKFKLSEYDLNEYGL